jgi:hypothetical protein
MGKSEDRPGALGGEGTSHGAVSGEVYLARCGFPARSGYRVWPVAVIGTRTLVPGVI